MRDIERRHAASRVRLSPFHRLSTRRLLRTGVAGLGALSLVLATIAPAYAESSSIGTPALAGLAAAPAPAGETPGDGAGDVSPYDLLVAPEAANGNSQSGGGAPQAPGNGGHSAGQSAKFTPPDTPYNGAFTRSFPIEVPPFFELTPRLALGYQSGDNRLHAGDGFSPLGVGWSLGGGSLIERQSAHGGVPRFDASDVFSLDGNTLLDCLVGATTRVTPSCHAGGTHTGRYETYERINKIAASNSWEVTARDGSVSLYAPLATFNPAGTQDARLRSDYRWLLSSVTDTDGNVVTYSYDCAALPTCYVSAITFGTSSVEFSWEARPDSFTYATGISLGNVDKRLKTIAVKTGASLVRAYKLSYAVSPNTKRSLLSSLRQYGSDATITSGTITAGTALPADSFTYFDMSSRRTGTALQKVTATTAADSPGADGTGTAQYAAEATSNLVVTPPDNGEQFLLGDFNGDSKQDLIVKSGNGTSQGFYLSGSWAGTGNPTGGLALQNVVPISLSDSSIELKDSAVGDFNGDGKDDVLVFSTITSSRPQTGYRSALISQGYVNGDGFVSVSYFDGRAVVGGAVAGLGPTGQTVQNPDVRAYWGLNYVVSNGVKVQDQPAVVGDFNGDGLDDFFRGEMFLPPFQNDHQTQMHRYLIPSANIRRRQVPGVDCRTGRRWRPISFVTNASAALGVR